MLSSINDYLRVITYVNIILSSFWFSLYKDIFYHRNILLILFFNNNILFLINIYWDSLQSSLKYLKNTEVDIHNVLVMTGDFDIRNSLWNLLYPHYSTHSNFLIDIMNSFSLGLLSRSLTVDFILFSLFTLFYFTLLFTFYFSIFRTTQVRVYQSCCHISHKLMA